MKTSVSLNESRTATDRRAIPARTHQAPLRSHVRRAVHAGVLSRPATRCASTPRRLSILPAGSAAAAAVDNALNKIIFGLFAVCGAIMGLTCFWHLQALVVKWSSFETAWSSLLQG